MSRFRQAALAATIILSALGVSSIWLVWMDINITPRRYFDGTKIDIILAGLALTSGAVLVTGMLTDRLRVLLTGTIASGLWLIYASSIFWMFFDVGSIEIQYLDGLGDSMRVGAWVGLLAPLAQVALGATYCIVTFKGRGESRSGGTAEPNGDTKAPHLTP